MSEWIEAKIAEARERRKELRDSIADVLVEIEVVDGVLAVLTGQRPERLEVPVPPAEPEVKAPEPEPPPEPKVPEGVSARAAIVEARDNSVLEYLQEHGPTPKTKLLKDLDIPNGSWSSLQPRLERKFDLKYELFQGGEGSGARQLIVMLPEQQLDQLVVEAPKPVVEADRDMVLELYSEKSPGRDITRSYSTRQLLVALKERYPEVERIKPGLIGTLVREAELVSDDRRDGENFPIYRLATDADRKRVREDRRQTATQEKPRGQQARKPAVKREPALAPSGEKKRQIKFAGTEALPEHLQAMPSAGVNMSLKRRLSITELQLRILQEVAKAGEAGILSNEIVMNLTGARPTVKGGLGRTKKGIAIGDRTRELRDCDPPFIEQAGTGFAPWQVQGVKQGESRGRPAIRYRVTEAGLRALPGGGNSVRPTQATATASGSPTTPQTEAPSEPSAQEAAPASPSSGAESATVEPQLTPEHTAFWPREEETRDAFRASRGPVSASDILAQVEEKHGEQAPPGALSRVTRQLDQLVGAKIGKDISPSDDMRLWEYAKPTGPGAAAQLDQQQRAQGAARGAQPGVQPVPGTGGRERASSPEVNELLRAISKAGGSFSRLGSTHFRVMLPGGGSTTIASTPSGSGIKQDREKLRKLGVTV